MGTKKSQQALPLIIVHRLITSGVVGVMFLRLLCVERYRPGDLCKMTCVDVRLRADVPSYPKNINVQTLRAYKSKHISITHTD